METGCPHGPSSTNCPECTKPNPAQEMMEDSMRRAQRKVDAATYRACASYLGSCTICANDRRYVEGYENAIKLLIARAGQIESMNE